MHSMSKDLFGSLVNRKKHEERGTYMRGRCKVLIVVALVFLINGVADAEFYSGQNLAEDWKAYKIMAQPNPLKSPRLLQGMAHYTGYVAGVIDSYYDLLFFSPKTTAKQLFEAVGDTWMPIQKNGTNPL